MWKNGAIFKGNPPCKAKQNALTLMVLRFWGFYICLCPQLIDDPFAHPGTQLKTFLFHTALHLITVKPNLLDIS